MTIRRNINKIMGFIQISVVALQQIGIQYQASFWISTASQSGGNVEKQSAYECGFEPVGDARMKFEILYYVIGILYLVFDLEILLILPLAMVIGSCGYQSFIQANVFIIIVTVGFFYEYIIGAQDQT